MENKSLADFFETTKSFLASINWFRGMSFGEFLTTLTILFFVFVGPILSVLNIVSLGLNFLRSDFRKRLNPEGAYRKVENDSRLTWFWVFVGYYVALIAIGSDPNNESSKLFLLVIIFFSIFPPLVIPFLAISGFLGASWALLIVEPFNFIAEKLGWEFRLNGEIRAEIR